MGTEWNGMDRTGWDRSGKAFFHASTMDWNGMDWIGLDRTVRDGIGKALFKASTTERRATDGNGLDGSGLDWRVFQTSGE